MKKCVILGFVIFLSIVSSLNAQHDWHEVKNSDGIKIYTRPTPGSPLDEFKGIAIIDSPIEVIVEVLRDVEAQPEWMADCIEAKVLKRISENDYLVYSMNRAPWPVSNRDVVVRSIGNADIPNGKVKIIFTALKDSSIPPRPGVVRMTELVGQWHLKKINSHKTEVVFIIKANPGGNIPPRLANLTSKEIPFKTLRNLRKMVKKEKYILLAQEKYNLTN
ncbi:MAG: START domain-containing protein [Spirochaetes bacterium]|nr:START domain-containing protein [Spirochaetota bacterium]